MHNDTNNHLLPYTLSIPARTWLKAGILTAVLVYCYLNPLSLMVRTWLDRDGYSHGFIVPFISMYFAYADRERLRRLPIQPNITGGLALILISSSLLIFGEIGNTATVQQIALFTLIPGLALLFLGTRYTKGLALPLVYLTLMFPIILDLAIARLHWPFQLFTATASTKLLRILDIPAFRDVQYIELPGATLEVANACSGVRYLLSIIALGVPLAYFTQKSWARRILLVTFAVLVGVLANPLRVTLIGIWTYYTGQDVHGPLHIFQGIFVSVVGFIFLLAGAWVLARIPTPATKDKPRKEEQCAAGNSEYQNKAWTTAMLVLVTLGGFVGFHNPHPVPLQAPLSELPLTIGNWRGQSANSPAFNLKICGADDEVNRIYRNDQGREIRLQIGYFEYQRKEKELAHPELQELYKDAGAVEIPTASPAFVRANKTVLRKGMMPTLVLYWHDLNGRITADRYKIKLFTIIESLIHQRTNGATIIISGNLTGPGARGKTLNDEVEFSRQLIPVLNNYLHPR